MAHNQNRRRKRHGRTPNDIINPPKPTQHCCATNDITMARDIPGQHTTSAHTAPCHLATQGLGVYTGGIYVTQRFFKCRFDTTHGGRLHSFIQNTRGHLNDAGLEPFDLPTQAVTQNFSCEGGRSKWYGSKPFYTKPCLHIYHI